MQVGGASGVKVRAATNEKCMTERGHEHNSLQVRLIPESS